MRGFSPRFVCMGISVTDSHQTSDFCECPTTIYVQRRYRFSVRNFSDVPGKPVRASSTSPVAVCEVIRDAGTCDCACHLTLDERDRLVERCPARMGVPHRDVLETDRHATEEDELVRGEHD